MTENNGDNESGTGRRRGSRRNYNIRIEGYHDNALTLTQGDGSKRTQ